jgi:hypothetical protein
MMQKPGEIVYNAIVAGDVELVRQQLKAHPELVTLSESGWLHDAARYDSILVAQMLVDEFGIDVNWPRWEHVDLDRPLCAAASHGRLNMARWLLDHGADVNGSGGTPPLVWAAGERYVEMVRLLLDYGAKINVGGDDKCPPLASAATGGSLEVARLLLERGADPNVLYGRMQYGEPPTNALKQAMMFGHQEVATLLRSHGAILPPSCELGNGLSMAGDVLEHIERHLGKTTPLPLHEIVPGDPAITIHSVPMLECLALVTTGMSDRAMTVPEGGEEYQFAELVIYLPADWPLTEAALQAPNTSWPINWLRRIAHSPHDNQSWLGGASAIIANGEPPKPLAPNTRLTCLLALFEANEFGSLHLPDGRRVVFYTLYPLYTEERNLEKDKGLGELLRLLQQHQISRIVDVDRLNVVREFPV